MLSQCREIIYFALFMTLLVGHDNQSEKTWQLKMNCDCSLLSNQSKQEWIWGKPLKRRRHPAQHWAQLSCLHHREQNTAPGQLGAIYFNMVNTFSLNKPNHITVKILFQIISAPNKFWVITVRTLQKGESFPSYKVLLTFLTVPRTWQILKISSTSLFPGKRGLRV